jgi:microcystin-dependent protein
MTEAQAHIAAEAGAHGITGSFVGTTDTQTLTNKTITGGTVNPTTLQQGGVSVVTTTGTQALTNKTLDAATITGTTTATSGTIALGTNASAITANGATISATEVGYLDGVTSALQTQLTTNTPVGMVAMHAGASAPTGWLLCDGATKSTTTNPELANLYSIIGTSFGGTGATSFNLPNFINKFARAGGVVGTTGGSMGHTHDFYDVSTDNSTNRLVNYAAGGSVISVAANGHDHTVSGNTGFDGNLPPYLVINFIIKF